MPQSLKRSLSLSAMLALGSTVTLFGAVVTAHADPQNGVITFGDVTIEQGTGITTVTQSTDRGAITWDSFNVGTGERVTFDQPGPNAITLNTVRTPAPSNIQGMIDAPGQVWIANPSGVLIGPDATIDVGGLLATTGTIETDDFAAGRDQFRNALGQVVNHGEIVAREGGVVLVAPDVLNTGQITVMGGDVQLHAGTAFTIDMEGDGLLGFTVEGDTEIAKQLTNTGTIKTDGGAVYLTAAAANAVVDSVITAGGVIEATSVTQRGGDIILGGDGQIHVDGTLNATKADQGGTVEVTAPSVAINATARIDTSADMGGGTIRIGDKGGIDPSEVVVVYGGAEINADANVGGTAGEIEIWSEAATWFFGNASARAHTAGDAGFIEISSRGFLDYDGTVVLDAPNGRAGTLLFDPDFIFVVAAGADDAQVTSDLTIALADAGTTRAFTNPVTALTNNFGNAMTISATTLNSLTGTVLLEATDTIHVAADLTLGTQDLTLRAGNTIAIDADISITNGSLTLEGLTGNPVDLVRVATESDANTNLRSITLTNGDFTVDARGPVELHASIAVGTGIIDVTSLTSYVFLDSDVGFNADYIIVFAPRGTIANGTGSSIATTGFIRSDGPLLAATPGINLVGRDIAIGSTLTSASDIFIRTSFAGLHTGCSCGTFLLNPGFVTAGPEFVLTTTATPTAASLSYDQGQITAADGIVVDASASTTVSGPIVSTAGSVNVTGDDLLTIASSNTVVGSISGNDVVLATINAGSDINIISSATITGTTTVEIDSGDTLNVGDTVTAGLTNHVTQLEFDTISAPTVRMNSRSDMNLHTLSFSDPATTALEAIATGNIVVDALGTGLTTQVASGLQTITIAGDGNVNLSNNISTFNANLNINARNGGTITLDPATFINTVDLSMRAADFVLSGIPLSTSSRLIMTGTPTIGTGGVLDNAELGSFETSRLVVESESNLIVGTLALFDTNSDRNIPDLVLTAATDISVTGDVAGSFDFSSFSTPINVSFGEQGGVIPTSLSSTGRLGFLNGAVDPFSLLEFYIAGNVTLDPPFSAGETILAATAVTIDITGAFDQRNTLNPTLTTELPHGVGGAGAILGSVSLINATALELYGTIGNLSNDLARNGVTASFATTTAHQVNDCVLGTSVCNQIPVGTPDVATGDEATVLTVDVVANDVDTDNDTLTITQLGGQTATVGTTVAGTNGGLFRINSAGQIEFDPNGEYEFLSAGTLRRTAATYQVDDGFGGTSTATVTVTVNGLNDAPTATDVAVATNDRTNVTADPALTDIDRSDRPQIISINGATVAPGGTVAGTNGGTFRLSANGQFLIFIPGAALDAQLNTGASVVTTATVGVSDANGGTTSATVNVTVTGIGAMPMAVDDTGSVIVGSTTVVDAVANDTDADVGDTLSLLTVGGQTATSGVMVTGSNGGVFTVLPSGAISFDPGGSFGTLAPGASATTSLVYTITDTTGSTDMATINVTVSAPQNPTPPPTSASAPTALDDTGLSVLATPVNVPVLSNDSDPDVGDSISLSAVGGLTATPGSSVAGTNGGIFRVESDGSITFIPGTSFSNLQPGAVSNTSVLYTIVDTMGNSATATLTVDVTSQLALRPPLSPETPTIPDPEVVSGKFNEISIVEPLLEEDEPLTNRGNSEEWR